MQHVFCSPHPALRKTPVAAALGIKRTRKGVNSIKRNKENKHRKKRQSCWQPWISTKWSSKFMFYSSYININHELSKLISVMDFFLNFFSSYRKILSTSLYFRPQGIFPEFCPAEKLLCSDNQTTGLLKGSMKSWAMLSSFKSCRWRSLNFVIQKWTSNQSQGVYILTIF